MLKKSFDFIEKLIMIIIGILMGLMVAIITYQVVMRYAFANAPVWADEFARYMMIWIIMLATPVGFRRYRHINIDVLVRYFPPKLRKFTDTCMNVLLLVFLAVLLNHTLTICVSVRGQISQSSGIPMSFMYSSVAISAVLSMIVVLENMFNQVFNKKEDEGG